LFFKDIYNKRFLLIIFTLNIYLPAPSNARPKTPEINPTGWAFYVGLTDTIQEVDTT